MAGRRLRRGATRLSAAPEYFEGAWYAEPEAIERLQLQRLKEKAWHAYRAPFHRNRWDAAGFHPSSIASIGDLWKAPAYTVDDIRRSIDAHPPWGDYQGVTPAEATPRADPRVHVRRYNREVPAHLLHRVGP